MKILIVEDDPDFVLAIRQDVLALNGHASFSVAHSRDVALERVRNNFYDLVLLDLKVPTVDGALDEESAHGYAVGTTSREEAPGTPIFVLTGSSADPFVDNWNSEIEQIDIWGAGQRLPTIKFWPKFKYANFPREIAPYLQAFDKIFDIEIERGGVQLSSEESRLLRIFSRKRHAAKCAVEPLNDGLSGAKVLRLKLTDSQGAPIYDAVTKLGMKEEVFDENRRFEAHITRLAGQATPRKLGVVEYGAGRFCGVFYSLAAGFDGDAFAVAGSDANGCATLVGQLDRLTEPWRRGQPQTRRSIRSIRQGRIGDEKFAALRPEIPFGWIEEFEGRSIQVVESCVHGDMHGLNVLVSAELQPILIDYGDVGAAPASLDAVTLELSMFFHTKGPLRNSSWPNDAQALEWGNLDLYLVDCPHGDFIRACRGWASKCAAGNREIAAVAYGYLARQLKYENQNCARIFSLMAGAKRFFDTAT